MRLKPSFGRSSTLKFEVLANVCAHRRKQVQIGSLWEFGVKFVNTTYTGSQISPVCPSTLKVLFVA